MTERAAPHTRYPLPRLRFRTGEEPPGPRLLRALRPLLKLRYDRISPIMEAFEQYGDTVMFRVTVKNLYLLKHPDAIQELLVSRHRDMRKDSGHQLFLKPILGNGLLVSEGDFHLRQRRMMQPAFHRKQVADYAEAMVHFGTQEAASWEDGARIDVMRAMMRVALGVVGKTLFNSDTQGDAKRVADAIEDIMPMDAWMLHPLFFILMRLPLKPVRRFYRAMADLDATVLRMIEEHRADQRPERDGDIIDMLLAARDQDDGGAMTARQVRDEVLTLFLAGHETTANTLAWAWHLLGQNPEAEARMHEEVDRVLGGRAPTMEDYPQLEYTRRVFAETLRLYPAAYLFGRLAMRDTHVAGYQIPRGSELLVSPFATHRDARWWPDPERFDPDRHLPEAAKERPKYAYVPFGAGIRKCIGEHFAWMEGVFVLATVAQRWRLRPVPDHEVAIDPRITLRPKGGLPMQVAARE